MSKNEMKKLFRTALEFVADMSEEDQEHFMKAVVGLAACFGSEEAGKGVLVFSYDKGTKLVLQALNADEMEVKGLLSVGMSSLTEMWTEEFVDAKAAGSVH